MAASTVSRAFSRPGRVNASTRRHVLTVAERLGYRPNPAARALETGRTDTVALLVPDITNPYFFGVIKGAERAAVSAGLTLVLGDTQENPAQEAEMLDRLGPAVDGFVLAASRLPDAELHAACRATPVVLVNRAEAGLACVVADFDSGTEQIVDHLASLGHRSFVFAGGPAESWSGARRWAGLQAAARSRALRSRRMGPYAPTLHGGPGAADAAVALNATAIVCHNDMLAIGVLRRLAARGLRVPDDMSVVGFDDVFASALITPSLTTLGERTEEAGRRAVETLRRHEVHRPEDPPALVLPTTLKIRASTGPAPGNEPGSKLNEPWSGAGAVPPW